MRPLLRSTGSALRILRKIYGEHPRTCSYCRYHGRFYAYGKPMRLDAMCSSCGALERERQVILADQQRHFFTGKRVLHFAPEPVLREYICSVKPASYITTDLNMPNVDTKENIEQLSFAEGSFDVVFSSHVLEHVDDKKALKELYRILAPQGMALIMVPLVEAWAESYENPEVQTTELRERHFGQWDHVRFYGRDIRNRIRQAGFSLEEMVATEPHVNIYGLIRGETIFIATKN